MALSRATGRRRRARSQLTMNEVNIISQFLTCVHRQIADPASPLHAGSGPLARAVRVHLRGGPLAVAQRRATPPASVAQAGAASTETAGIVGATSVDITFSTAALTADKASSSPKSDGNASGELRRSG